jgi:hypothetical protein
MAELSDRSVFLEMIKLKPMTINEIVDAFGVAKNTARDWSKHSEVEKVVGSWPPQFKRKNVFVENEDLSALPAVKKTKKNIVELPDVTIADKERFFRSILDNDPATVFDFQFEFRTAESLDDVKLIRSKLISSLIITDYYLDKIRKEEMD